MVSKILLAMNHADDEPGILTGPLPPTFPMVLTLFNPSRSDEVKVDDVMALVRRFN